MQKAIKILFKLAISDLFDLGVIFIFSLFFLYWWIYGDYNRYLWIISGPFPYSNFGSGPFLSVLSGGLFVVGMLFILVSFVLRNKCCKD